LAGLVLVGACLTPASAQAGEPPKDIPAIPVVKTWGELRKQPAIDLGRGVLVRLGIEAAECGLAEGVFVYCMTEGYAPPESWKEVHQFGPLFLALTDGDGKQLDVWSDGIGLVPHRKVVAGLDECQLLFLRRVVVVRQGVVRVRVEHRVPGAQPRLVAAAEVKGARTGHPFLRFDYTGPERTAGQTEFLVQNSAAGPALPSWPEFCELVSQGKVGGADIRRPAEELLPKLIPDAPSPALEVTVADGVLIVRSKSKIGTYGPEYHFLARWWVNGKTVSVAVPKKPDYTTIGKAFTDDKPWPEVKLRLDLALDRLGAKSGDDVGVQLMYCEHGSEPVHEERMTIIKGWKRDTLPLLSNRVAFRVK
jgi:hypothetical protein